MIAGNRALCKIQRIWYNLLDTENVSRLLLAQKKKNIVILGGGVCGLMVAKKLAHKLEQHEKIGKEYRLIVINKTTVHVYQSDLYEISTAYNKEINAECLTALEDAVCINIDEAAEHMGIDFIRDMVTAIDPDKKKVSLRKGEDISYEYLVVAVGSVTNFYGIPGLAEQAHSLKTLADALALNCHIDQFFYMRWKKNDTSPASFIIGGGGATGVEYACELIGYVEQLSHKYHFDPAKVTVSIVTGSPDLIGIGEKPSKIAERRLKKLGIETVFNTYIQGFQNDTIQIEHKETGTKGSMPADILIWTGGIKPNPLTQAFKKTTKSGELEVKKTLEYREYPRVYAGGDNAAVLDPETNKPVPKTGQFAMQEGKAIADNIWAAINGKEQKEFQPFLKGYIVPLGGKYWMFHRKNITLAGFIPYLMRRVHDILYFAHYMPLRKAVSRIFHKERIFVKND